MTKSHWKTTTRPCYSQTLKSFTTITVIDDDSMVSDATTDLISSLGYTAIFLSPPSNSSIQGKRRYLVSDHRLAVAGIERH
jgi:hypothetical protein